MFEDMLLPHTLMLVFILDVHGNCCSAAIYIATQKGFALFLILFGRVNEKVEQNNKIIKIKPIIVKMVTCSKENMLFY